MGKAIRVVGQQARKEQMERRDIGTKEPYLLILGCYVKQGYRYCGGSMISSIVLLADVNEKLG